MIALGLAIAIEGFAYALFPDFMRRMLAHLLTQPLTSIRMAGLAAAALGVAFVWLVRG